jgi:hypothetical protein
MFKPVFIFIAAAILLAGCQSNGPKDVAGASIGAGGCRDSNAADTTIDWRSFGKNPEKVKFCKYTGRSMELVLFADFSDNTSKTIKLEGFQGTNLISTENAAKILPLVEAERNVMRIPGESEVKSGTSFLGNFHYVPFDTSNSKCIYYMIYYGSYIHSGYSVEVTRTPVHGRICAANGSTHASNIVNWAVGQVEGLRESRGRIRS